MPSGQTGVDGILGPATQSAIKAFQELKGIEPTGIVDESTLNALKEATSETKNLTGNIDKLIDGIDKLGGREKLIESFKNIFKTLGDVVKPVMFSNPSMIPFSPPEPRNFPIGLIIEENPFFKRSTAENTPLKVLFSLSEVSSLIFNPSVKDLNLSINLLNCWSDRSCS